MYVCMCVCVCLLCKWEDLEPVNARGETCHVVEALIGEGAGGRVYRARHRLQASAPPYAVKVFKAHHERRIPPEVARECEARAFKAS